MNKRIRKKKEKQAEALMKELGLVLTREEAFRASIEKIWEVIVTIAEVVRRRREQQEEENGKAADGEGGR